MSSTTAYHFDGENQNMFGTRLPALEWWSGCIRHLAPHVASSHCIQGNAFLGYIEWKEVKRHRGVDLLSRTQSLPVEVVLQGKKNSSFMLSIFKIMKCVWPPTHLAQLHYQGEFHVWCSLTPKIIQLISIKLQFQSLDSNSFAFGDHAFSLM